jgi:hypothetical protein
VLYISCVFLHKTPITETLTNMDDNSSSILV